MRLFWKSAALAAAVALAVSATRVEAGAMRLGIGFETNSLPPNDDGSSSLVGIGFSANYFGTTYSSLYVNNNGNLTFTGPMSGYTPFGLSGPLTPIIAPFFADVDTRAGGAVTQYGTGVVDAHAAFGATWNGVGYYGGHIDKLNNFQVVLIDRSDINPGDFDIELNYDHIAWETGDASGGSGGFGGTPAVAGYSNGSGDPGTNYQLPGSLTSGAFEDGPGPFALTTHDLNSDVEGRYLFHVRNGVVEATSPEPATLTMLGMGVMSLAGYRLRKRKQTA